MADKTDKIEFSPGESWQIEVRGSVEDVAAQVRGLVRVPATFREAIASEVDAVWPADSRGDVLVAVKIFCRVNKIQRRDKTVKRELHLNGSVTEI